MAYLQRRNIPRKQRLCSVCFQACSFSYIFCDHCSQWVHTNCDGIEDEKVKEFERLPPDFPYICRKCRCDDEGHLDYGRALQRLHKVDLLPVGECDRRSICRTESVNISSVPALPRPDHFLAPIYYSLDFAVQTWLC